MNLSEEYKTPRTSFRLVLLSFINRSFLWLLTRFSSKATTDPFWRLCGRFLFVEIQARQWRGPLSPQPYILFERYFASSPEHLERFQNFVAGNGLLNDLLAANWFEYLPIKDRVPVTSLFRRIYKAENVWLSYRNRPAIVERSSTLENVDQDSLPKSVFIVPERSVGRAMDIWLRITKVFSGTGNFIETSLRQIIKSIDTLVSYLTLLIIGIPLAIISILGLTSPNLQATITRIKILLLAALKPQSKRIGHHLSRYETLYAGDAGRAEKMIQLLKKPDMQRLLTEDLIDNLAFKDRVLVTSLLRRSANADSKIAQMLRAKNLDEAIAVRSQRHVAQLTQPSAKQIKEWNIFKKLNLEQKHENAQTTLPAKVATSVPIAKKLRARPVPSSESVLQKHEWFTPANKADLAFATMLRERAFNDAAEHLNNADAFAMLSPQMKIKAGAIMALLQKPFTHKLAAQEINQNLLVPKKITDRASQSLAEDAFSAALTHLYPVYDVEAARSPLACWTNLQDALADDTEFSYAAEVLTAAYSGTAYNRVTDRTVSFDTFLITRLEEILDKIRLWVDWDECPISALVAYAYAAAAIGDRTNFDFFIMTLDSRAETPPRFVINLRDNYFNSGIHSLDAILSPSTFANEESQLRKIAKNKKYLCLVEMGARVQALRQIEGVNDNLLCGPVAPTDAIKFPTAASLVQAEDFIPMYSAEDMKIGAEVDRLTEHYLDKARESLKTSGISGLYENAIEVTHATIYFALYRDTISAVICEKLIATAADYDGVILLTKTGQILGNMIAPAIEAVGRENVYLSLGSHRASEFFSALTKIRAAAKSVKSVSKTTEISDDWMSNMRDWISESMNFHGHAMQNVKNGPYSIMTLEHINGYFDSYQALIRQGLPHSHVELFTSAANVQLNDHIMEGGFTSFENTYELRHKVMRPRTPDARPWVIPFAETLRGSFERFDSPYLAKYHDMILERAQAVFTQRLPQIMDAVSYFRARFAQGLPDYVFTGPNQHMISRAAAYCAKASGVPVYDFLILANTDHPRYRPIIADYAYLYDPWYKNIYQSFFGMKKDQLRTAGPLFEYSERLKQAPKKDYAAPRGKTHIVFFSQSANFDNSKIILESICQATKDRKDIYITVKLHPHESPANIERYTQIAADNDVKGNIYVFHHGDAVALLNQADLVVQSFSNIGLDALLLKKPVITFKPKTDLKARIFLYEKDIGYVVSTKRTLTNKIRKFLKDPKDREAMQTIANKFAAENDHFLRGDNAARVMKTVQEDVVRFKEARES